MLQEARAAGSPRIFSASGFATRDISILQQQMRCANLAWALKFTGKLKPGDVVGIIGGSISGLMLAACLAMCNDVMVYIFEKEDCLLKRFLDKSHRFISPNLNSRSLRKAFDPVHSRPFYEPPLFKWNAGVASTVAGDWLNEFREIAAKLPIFCFFNTDLSPGQIECSRRRVRIQPARNDKKLSQPAFVLDWLIDATGFGSESNPLKLTDFSYWESGHRLTYDHLPPKSRVLISGCGDSGLIELMHYAIKDFSNEKIRDFWPPAPHLDIVIDERLECASFDDVMARQYDDIDFPLIGELLWFYGLCRNAAGGYNPHPSTLDPQRKRIFDAVENAVLKVSRRRPREHDRACWERYLDIVPVLTENQQRKVRAAVRPAIDNLSSVAIKAVMQEIDLAKIYRLSRLHRLARPGVEVVLNGTTPTPFTRQLSPFNVWLMHVMLSFPNVRYRCGKLEEAKQFANGRYRVRIGNNKLEIFDRVVTRYGPAAKAGALFTSKFGGEVSWLLTPPYITQVRGSVCSYIDLAKRDIEIARRQLLKRPTKRRQYIDKDLFVNAVTIPAGLRRKFPQYLEMKTYLFDAVRTGQKLEFEPQRGV